MADTLVDLVTLAGHDPATRADIEGFLVALAAMDEGRSERFAAMDARVDALDVRWSGCREVMDVRWEERSAGTEHRLPATLERGREEAITSQTRALVVSLLVSVVAIAGLAFGRSD